MESSRKRLFLCLTIHLLAACAHSMRPVLRAPRDAPTTGRCTVVLKPSVSKEEQQKALLSVMKVADDAKVYGYVEKVAKAFTVELSPFAMEIVRYLPQVEYLEEEGMVEGTQDTDLYWHLDRLDQARLPLDLFYSPIGDGAGVDVYILDTGISYHHQEFENRAKYAGYDPVDAYEENAPLHQIPDGVFQRRFGADCHGHGTHVASLAGGKTHGSAKKVTLYSIRVLQCNNAAPWSTVLDGLDYLSKIIYSRGRPAIASLSLGGSYYRTVNDAVWELNNQGVHVITAAGNGINDACSRSPASSPFALTVGGSRDGDGLYTVGSGTNYGACVDIFAPGEHIWSADYNCATCSVRWSGTSMSTPITSGVAAIHLARQPLLTPQQLRQKLLDESIKGALNFTGIPQSSWEVTPNRLLHIEGACGGNTFILSHVVLTSPGYPAHYPPNLECQWVISGNEGQYVQLNFTHIALEKDYDQLYLYDGYCCNQTNLLGMFTGDYGQVSLSYRSSGTTMTLVLKTDQSDGAQGFRAIFTKLYRGTDLKVPDPDVELPTVPTTGPRPPTVKEALVFYRSKTIRTQVSERQARGFNISWVTAYKVGQSPRAYYDVVFHNSTTVRTRGYVELTPDQLKEKMAEMRAIGLSLRYLSCRTTGSNTPRPFYAAVFDVVPEIIETLVYLQESMETYDSRLREKKAQGYQLVSHCFHHRPDLGRVDGSSVYTRDRRVAFNITVPPPLKWESFNHLTFYEFTFHTLNLTTHNMYLSFVDIWNYEQRGAPNPESYFACVYTERTEDKGEWFRWAMNTTATRQMVRQYSESWDPMLMTGYSFQGQIDHFIQFRRKG